jgi:MFS-type transporter involved in bile tolerance (Atg22 family)
VGLGRGFAVHKALDQVGAVAGPLVVAAVAALTGALWPAMAVLAVPGAAAVVLLVRVRSLVGDPPRHEQPAAAATKEPPSRSTRRPGDAPRLPRQFWLFAASAGLATAGLVTFGVISYHLVREHVVPVATVPVVYAAAMASAATAALVTGWCYDRWNARVLVALPALVAAVPALAFSDATALAVTGVLLWGAAVGVQDSTVKALVAELVPAPRRATAYGFFAAMQGAAAVIGGAAAGALYSRSVAALVAVVVTTQVGALGVLLFTLRRPRG